MTNKNFARVNTKSHLGDKVASRTPSSEVIPYRIFRGIAGKGAKLLGMVIFHTGQ